MFVQQKKLTFLNLPAKRLRRLFSSTVDVMLVLPGFPAQNASAYLLSLTSGAAVQILLGLYLVESRCSVFFLPEAGEVAPEKAESLLKAGLEFAESMGFVLADADIHRLDLDQRDAYWQGLPICCKPADPVSIAKQASPEENKITEPAKIAEPVPTVSLDTRRQRCKESLGRFLASL